MAALYFYTAYALVEADKLCFRRIGFSSISTNRVGQSA